MKIDIEKIKDLPVVTSTITVDMNLERFFSSYSIISYYSIEDQTLAYEQLADEPCLSVAGLYSRWPDTNNGTTKFFILIEKEHVNNVMASLTKYEKIRFKNDDLSEYTENQQKRIIASLSLNSLGKTEQSKMMYCNGALLICDDKNFLIRQSKKELVCLKIEINEYLNLTAKTTSFSKSQKEADLQKHKNCIFKVCKDISGQLWSGYSVKPVVYKNLKDSEKNFDELYIQKKAFSDNHNIVPYWPYNPEDYTHGKLFAICQVVELINKKYKGIISIDFKGYNITHYDEYKAGKDMLDSIKEYMNGRSIYFEDPFDNEGSRIFVEELKGELQTIMDNSLIFPKEHCGNEMMIKVCNPINTNDTNDTTYSPNNDVATQHIIFNDNSIKDTIHTAEARRILIELLVKDCLIHKQMPQQMASMLNDWIFYRYKIIDGNILGATLQIKDNDSIDIQNLGNWDTKSTPLPFEEFVNSQLLFEDTVKINGSRDYMALKKDGNVFLIIDTDEIPILDVNEIDEGYNQIINESEKLSMFKRKAVAHKYLRGYIGFHLWKTDGLDAEPDGSYSYIAGYNSENMQIMRSTKMDRMPRVHRIFILHKEQPDLIESQIMEICNFLKYGYGRWNEIMTHPFPFKFLYEHLDYITENTFHFHWNELCNKRYNKAITNNCENKVSKL